MRKFVLAAFCAAGVLTAAGQASAAIIDYDFYGLITSGFDPANRFTTGDTVDFHLTWDTTKSTQVWGTDYRIAAVGVGASVNGFAINLGSDIYDHQPVYYDETIDQGHDTRVNFSAPLVIYDSTGVKGIEIYSDGGVGSDNPGLETFSGVSGNSVCERTAPDEAFSCNGHGDASFSNSALFKGGLYQNTYQGGATLTLDFGSFARAAVPEPSNWAMMIMGAGLAGVALRRRRVATA